MYDDIIHHTPIIGYDAGLTDSVGNPICIVTTGSGLACLPNDIEVIRGAFTQLMHTLNHVKDLKDYNMRMSEDIRANNIYCIGIAVHPRDDLHPMYDIQNYVEMIREPYHADSFARWLWKQKYNIFGNGLTRDPFYYKNKGPLLYVRCDFDLDMYEDEIAIRRDLFAHNIKVSRICEEYGTGDIIENLLKIYNDFEIGNHVEIK